MVVQPEDRVENHYLEQGRGHSVILVDDEKKEKHWSVHSGSTNSTAAACCVSEQCFLVADSSAAVQEGEEEVRMAAPVWVGHIGKEWRGGCRLAR